MSLRINRGGFLPDRIGVGRDGNVNQPGGNAGLGGAAAAPGADSYLARLAKLIPAEALGLYSAGLPVIQADSTASRWLHLAWAGVALGFSLFIRIREMLSDDDTRDVAAVLIGPVSFAIWLFTLPPGAAPVDLGQPTWIALTAIGWGAIAPQVHEFFSRRKDAAKQRS